MTVIDDSYHFGWADILLIFIGIIPYIALSFADLYFWNKYMGFLIIPADWSNMWSQYALAGFIYFTLSLFGLYCLWYLLCKIIKLTNP